METLTDFNPNYITLVGQKGVYDAIIDTLTTAGHPTDLVKYYNPEDPLLHISGGWLRDCRVAAIHGESHSYIPSLMPTILYHRPHTTPPFITGRGARAENHIAMDALSTELSIPFIKARETVVEGGNCLKLRLPQKDGSTASRVAIIGMHSLWISHQVAFKETLPKESDLRNDITEPLDYETLKIVIQLIEGSFRTAKTFDPSNDYPFYRLQAITYAKQQQLVLEKIKTDLCVDKVVCIEQSDFHIDLRCFTLRNVFFMHSTRKTMDLLHRLLLPAPGNSLLLRYYENALNTSGKLIPLEERNKHHLEQQGIEVVEICGVLEQADSEGIKASFMNVAVLAGNIMVNFGCPPVFNFLKTAFQAGVKERFPDQEILFTKDTTVFQELVVTQGGFRCASTEIPLTEPSPEQFPGTSVLDQTHTAINALNTPTQLSTLFTIMHDLNITWATDLRKRILLIYNESEPTTPLPTDWDTASTAGVLDRSYFINIEALAKAFIQLTNTLPPPPL